MSLRQVRSYQLYCLCPDMKRNYNNYTLAQLSYPKSYQAALKRRRLARTRAVIPRNLVGVVRTTGSYRRSAPGSIEKKFHDMDDSLTVTGAGKVVCLNNIPQGTSDKQRVGAKITIKNINVRYSCNLDPVAGSGAVGGNARVMIVLDKQANGAQATVIDVLKDREGAKNNLLVYRNLDNDERFQVLYDKFTNLNYNMSQTLTNEHVGPVKKINKKVNIPISFSSVSGEITEIRSNNLFLLVITSHDSMATDYSIRIKYTDL